MMISESFRELHRRGEGALIGFITGGDPSPKISQQIIETIAKEGADIIKGLMNLCVLLTLFFNKSTYF